MNFFPYLSTEYSQDTMVLDHIKERAFDYLKSKGLTKEDIGRVIGIFFFAKYITFLSMIPVCYRCQPLRRFIKPVTTKDYFIARRNKFNQSRFGQSINQKTKSYQHWLKQNNVENNVAEARKRMNVFMQEKRQQVEEKRAKLASTMAREPPSGWRVRLYNWTEKIAEKAAKNERWKNVAKGLHVPPKQLAYAIGEGLVFYKITSPIWMPLELYGIVKFLQWRNEKKIID